MTADRPAPSDDGPADDRPTDLDFGGSRRLTGGEEWFWYVFAAVTYIAASLWHKWLLNWLIGPIWLVAIIVVGPWAVDRVRARFSGSAS